MNENSPEVNIGTVGELLVQLRLLEFDVQAAPPLKDSGNDLIAVRGQVFRAIQVKTSKTKDYRKPDEGKQYHILAVVDLHPKNDARHSVGYFLDQSDCP